MKLILAEKPSVARYISEYLGATNKMDGYFEGNGYCVSWAQGHLLSIGHAKDYGFEKWSDIPLPYFPKFNLFPKKDKGLKALLAINKKLMNRADLIINATDAEREGELIFRYIYEYSGCNKPVKRLWISSLTKESIEEGFRSLKDSSLYDNLYLSAKARNHADWIVGINATTCMTLKTGILYSIGRVQTPVLKMIVDRTIHHRSFKSIKTQHLALSLQDGKFIAVCNEGYENNAVNKQKLESINTNLPKTCIVKSADFKNITEKPLKLFSLSSLQVDANRKFSFTADKTLALAQELYLKKLISYPRTDSEHLSSDMFNMVSNLFNRFKNIKKDFHFDQEKLSLKNSKVFDDSKVSDHHAIIPTSEAVNSLSEEEKKLYSLILLRFLASFSYDAKKTQASYILLNKDIEYHFSCSKYTTLGWKELFGNQESNLFIELAEGEQISCEPTISIKETKPKPLFNDATLIIAMNSAGKDIEDEEEFEAMKDRGLGTPATQAGIIERLIRSEYIKRKGKSLISVEKGEKLIHILDAKELPITSVQMTAEWEKFINQIKEGKCSFDFFIDGIKEYTSNFLSVLNEIDIKINTLNKPQIIGKCPKCEHGNIKEGKKSYYCSNFSNKEKPCDFYIFKNIAGKKITPSIVDQLLKKKKTKKLKFTSKKQKQYEAEIILKDDFTATLSF